MSGTIPRHGRSRRTQAFVAVAGFLLIAAAAGSGDGSRPGLSTGKTIDDLPVPASGYQVYLLGEMHGIVQNEQLFEQYLIKLNRESGLRDVAIEEDSVYAPDARDYAEGRRETVPAPLCLRASILEAVRRINQGRAPGERVRIHLVDIDTPAEAIRLHLESIRARIPAAAKTVIPGVDSVSRDGLETVDSFERLSADPALLGELRSVRRSILANRQGLEAATGQPKGSPYLDDREQSIADNIRDILALPGFRGVLAFYGSDHISKSMRRDGGPNRDLPFAPMALRLEQAGLKVFSLMTFPLTGRWAWRGRSQQMQWTPDEGRLESGETLDKVMRAAGTGSLIYIDRTRHKVLLPSTDLTNYRTEAVLLFSGAIPLPDRCSDPIPTSTGRSGDRQATWIWTSPRTPIGKAESAMRCLIGRAIMWCFSLVFPLIVALTVPEVGPSLKTEAVCVTPHGTPCLTIRWEQSGWENLSWGFHAIWRYNGSMVMAYREDGAIMERHSQRNYRNYLVLDRQWDRQFIKLVPEQRTIEVDHRAREYESRERVRGGLPWWDPTNKDCVKSASGLKRVGEETIAGVHTIKFQGSESKTVRTQIWLAPSLGCTQLKLISYEYNQFGLPTSYRRSEAKSVRLGEPDAELFSAPSSYRKIR